MKTAKNKKSVPKKKNTKKIRSRRAYPDSLKKKVVVAIRKGMTWADASRIHDVVIHNIPNWIRKFS